MDILHLVDRLEELVNISRPMPFSQRVLIDEDRLIDIIDQMRVSIPDEVKKAQRVISERDRQLAQAAEEAERIKQLAREERDAIVGKDQIAMDARIKGDQIVEKARQTAAGIQSDSDEYVMETLTNMEAEMMQVLQQVRNGLLKMRSDRLEQNSGDTSENIDT